MLNKLICWLKGHKRGKRTEGPPALGKHEYCCPRCGALWYRKAKA